MFALKNSYAGESNLDFGAEIMGIGLRLNQDTYHVPALDLMHSKHLTNVSTEVGNSTKSRGAVELFS